MSLSHKGGRRSWRFLSQLRQHTNPPPLPRPLSAHLGLQKFRSQSSPSAPYGSFFLLSRPCLHHFRSSPSFSTAAEADHLANSTDTEAVSSIDSAETGIQRSSKEAASSAAVTSKLDGEQEEIMLRKMLEENRLLVSSLRAELEDQKTLARSILDEVRVLKSQADAKTAESKLSTKEHPWPEWAAFMEHLQSCEFFKDEKRAPPSDCSVFEDPACVKRAVYKFSQSHDFVFESLSQIDLRIIARYGCTANDPKAAASQKRLRQYFHIEDPSNAGAANSASTQPKLSDVTRLMHSTVLEGTFGDEVKSSLSYLLREIVTLSRKPSAVSPPAPEITAVSSKPSATLSPAAFDATEGSKQDRERVLKKEKVGESQKVSTGKGESQMVGVGKGEEGIKSEKVAPQWKCPRCLFMNLDAKHRCVECSRRRPRRTYASDTPKSTDGLDEDLDIKVLVDERQARKVREKKDSSPSPLTRGHESLKDRVPSLAVEEQDSVDDEQSSSEADVGSDPFDVLDDILESEDSDDEQEEGKVALLSEEAEEEQQGSGKRAPLSDLFAKKPSSSRRDDNRGLEQRNDFGKKAGRPLKGKRFEDDDDNQRSRHGSVGNDEQESSLEDDDRRPAHKSGRGFGSRDNEDNSRRSGRGGYNSFRGRGGSRGYGGGRGDSYDDRRNDGGPRGSRGYGDSDRGERSSNYGSRTPRGRSRF